MLSDRSGNHVRYVLLFGVRIRRDQLVSSLVPELVFHSFHEPMSDTDTNILFYMWTEAAFMLLWSKHCMNHLFSQLAGSCHVFMSGHFSTSWVSHMFDYYCVTSFLLFLKSFGDNYICNQIKGCVRLHISIDWSDISQVWFLPPQVTKLATILSLSLLL